MLTVVPDPSAGDDRSSSDGPLIDEIERDGVLRKLTVARQPEVDADIAQFTDERDERSGRPLPSGGVRGSSSTSSAPSLNRVIAACGRSGDTDWLQQRVSPAWSVRRCRGSPARAGGSRGHGGVPNRPCGTDTPGEPAIARFAHNHALIAAALPQSRCPKAARSAFAMVFTSSDFPPAMSMTRSNVVSSSRDDRSAPFAPRSMAA